MLGVGLARGFIVVWASGLHLVVRASGLHPEKMQAGGPHHN